MMKNITLFFYVAKKIEVPTNWKRSCHLTNKIPTLIHTYTFKMSVASSSSVSDVLARFDAGLAVFKELRKELAALLKTKKTKAKKEPGAASEEPKSAWVAWTALVASKYADAYAEHIKGLPLNAKGVQPKADVMGFASKCRKELFVEDWAEHERLWTSKPEPEPEPELKAAATVPDLPKASVPESKPKPKAKAKAKAKADQPSAEAAAEAVEWKNKGKVYMKNPANQVWQMEDDGVGEYVGFFDGKAILKGKLAAE